jgi:ankyrin repeat protein
MPSHSHSHGHGENCQHDHDHHSRSPEPSIAVDSIVHAEAEDIHATTAPSPADLLVMAVRSGSREMCEEIVRKHPAAVQGCDSENGATAVHWAALVGEVDLVGWLAEQGAQIDPAVEVSGMQPIHWAATRGHTEVVKLLLKLGADIDARDVKGTTPLVIASQ